MRKTGVRSCLQRLATSCWSEVTRFRLLGSNWRADRGSRYAGAWIVRRGTVVRPARRPALQGATEQDRGHLGMPQASADAFRLLGAAGRLRPETVKATCAMTGFRNVAVHQYRDLDMEIRRALAQGYWKSLVDFCEELGTRITP